MDLLNSAQASAQSAYQFIETTLLPILKWETFAANLSNYRERRTQSPQVLVDVFPALASMSVDNEKCDRPILLAAWILFLLGGRIIDDVLDQEDLEDDWHQYGLAQSVSSGISSIGMANVALTYLKDLDAARDISAAFNRAMALAAKSENRIKGVTPPTIADCLHMLMAKSGMVFAVGAWAGTRLGYPGIEESQLHLMHQYGLNTGIVVQILDDYDDIVADLQQGTWTLPVAYGLSLRSHPLHGDLKAGIQSREGLWAEHVRNLLEQMGVLDWMLQLAFTYQQRALSIVDQITGMKIDQKEVLKTYVIQPYLS